MTDAPLVFEVLEPGGDAARAARQAPMGLQFLLYGLQSPINIGMILRVAETYGFGVSIYDQHSVLANADRLATIRDFSCGALARRGFQMLDDEASLTRALRGRRLIATSIDAKHCPLPSYEFRAGDLFALGNEYDGLPDALLRRAATLLHIPMPAGWAPKPKAERPIDPNRTTAVANDGQPNLNVAMTAGIVCYAAYASMLARHHAAAAPSRR